MSSAAHTIDAAGLFAIAAVVVVAGVAMNANGTALTVALLAIPMSLLWLSRWRIRRSACDRPRTPPTPPRRTVPAPNGSSGTSPAPADATPKTT